jgi:L-seryl-tRNA(Ser) seleniumtransferase
MFPAIAGAASGTARHGSGHRAALAMLLLQNHGILMVHFGGLPPGTADLLVKFVPPETLERFGSAGRNASAFDDFLIHLDAMLQEPASIAELLLGTVPG